MEITLKGTAEEIASLVRELQGRRCEGKTPKELFKEIIQSEKAFRVDPEVLAKIAIDGIGREVQ